MLPPQASKLVCFSSNDKCNHHSFFYSEKFSLCYIFSKTDKLFAFFVTLLPNRNEYSQIYTTWRLTEHGDYRLEMPNSIPSSPCIEPLVNSNKQKQLPASSLQSFTAMSARGLFLSKLERRLQCQITHRYTQSWGHKRELTQRSTARCKEYTASSHQLQLSARVECEESRPQFMFFWFGQSAKCNSCVVLFQCNYSVPYQEKPLVFILIHLGFESSITKQRKCISTISESSPDLRHMLHHSPVDKWRINFK